MVLLFGCGAPGDPLPPLLNIPARATDLEVIQRGGDLVLRWTVPAATTEGMPLREPGRAVVLVADDEAALEQAAAEQAVLEGLKPGQRAEHRIAVPSGPGRRLAIAVRHESARGRSQGPSNVVVVEIAPPLGAPLRLAASVQPQGVRLTWDPVPGASGYQVFRRAGDEAEFSVVGQPAAPEFADPAVAWGLPHRYFVRPFVTTSTGMAEGTDSPVAEVTPEDIFPPSPPSEVRAAVTETGVDLSWNLSPEPDTAGYHVYRDGARLTASPVAAPAFTDADVRPGRRYSYAVSAVDQRGNESSPSDSIQVTIP